MFIVNENKVEFIKKLISEAKDQIVGVVFIKKDLSKRCMAFRVGIFKSLVKGSAPDITQKINTTLDERGMLRVGDLHKGGFRTVNLNTVLRLKVNGITYSFA